MQLEINNHKVGLQWGLGCFEIAAKHYDVVTVDEVLTACAKDSSTLARLAYSAIQNWVELQDETAGVPFTYRQFQAWLDEAPEQTGLDIVADFQKSKYNGKAISTHYEEINARYEEFIAQQDADKKKAPRKPRASAK